MDHPTVRRHTQRPNGHHTPEFLLPFTPPRAELIREVRELAHASHADVRDLVGVAGSRTVRGWEEGRTPRGRLVVERLNVVLGLLLVQALGGR